MNDFVLHLNALSETWFASMLRASWQGGLALLIALAVCRIASRLPGNVKCWIWRIAYAKLLVAFFWTTPIDLPLLAPVAAEPKDLLVHRSLVTEFAPHSEIATAPRLTSPTAATWLLTLWCAGLAACAVITMRDGRRLRSLKRSCVHLDDPSLKERAAQIWQALRLRKTPNLAVSDKASVPMVFGIFNPTVVLPANSSESEPDGTALMLAHEFAHVKRGDLCWSWMYVVVEALFFFHPLIRVARRESRLSQEMACDELAIRATAAQPTDYGRMLLAVVSEASLPIRSLSIGSAGILETKETLQRRIKSMLVIRSRPMLAGLGPALLLCVALVGILPWRVVAQKPEVPVTIAPDIAAHPNPETDGSTNLETTIPSIPPTATQTDALVWDTDNKTIEVAEGEAIAKFTFYFTNASPSEISITGLQPACGCTVAKLPETPWKIAPGQSGPISAEMNVQGAHTMKIKGLTVKTTAGNKFLTLTAKLPPPLTNEVAPPGFSVPATNHGFARVQRSDAERARNMQMAVADTQAPLKGDCASCHVGPAEGKHGRELYMTACAICHNAERRAVFVTDLQQKYTNAMPADFWHAFVSSGKPGTLMPAFAKEHGGFMSKDQVASLVNYLSHDFPKEERIAYR